MIESVNSESKNFATVAESLGPRASVALKILQDNGALEIGELNRKLKGHCSDFGDKLKLLTKSVSSWFALGIVEVELNFEKLSVVSLTPFGRNVLAQIQEKWGERLLTQGELKKLRNEALALSKGTVTFS